VVVSGKASPSAGDCGRKRICVELSVKPLVPGAVETKLFKRGSAMACAMITPPRLCPTRCTLSAPVRDKGPVDLGDELVSDCSTEFPSDA
jgi:hypothetical protein